jgi:aminopeptidase N
MQQKQDRRFESAFISSATSEEKLGWIKLEELTDEVNKPLQVFIDNTIGNVKLNRPLLPGENLTFKMRFETKFSSIMHRMNYKTDQWGNLQYSVAQWYPKICVYDRFGWHVDQHFGHEFYGDFGIFDVNINLPAHFILDATGVLQNKDEVLPDDLLKKIDIKNFKDKPFGEKPSIIVPETKDLKTWKFHAENVHDFAWIADPTFRRGFVKWNDIEVISYAREYKASKWQDAAEFTAKVIEIYSKDFGKYVYPKMIVSDVDNGMEYPMLTMDGGESPDYYGLFAHEVGHNWFYGILGNNETKEAFLDEGFTQFIESWSMERLTDSSGKFLNIMDYKNGSPPLRTDYRKESCFRGYLNLAKAGFEDKILTHSDWSTDGNTYGTLAYYKPATMLYNLQYVLGDELFLKCMKEYFSRWSLRHPYHQDFIDVIQQVSKRNLDWFFEQWLNTTRKCDYQISGVDIDKNPNDLNNPYKAEIELRRIGEMIMPIDLNVLLKNGQTLKFTIPIDEFPKHEKNFAILPKWTGWNDWNRTYKATISIPDKISEIEIDDSKRLADINRLNNKWPFPDFEFLFNDPFKRQDYSFYKLQILWGPYLWYNEISKLQFGLKLNIEHPRYFISRDIESNFDLWFNLKDFTPNFEIRIKTPNKIAGTLAYQTLYINKMDGRALGYVSFDKRFMNSLSSSNYTDISISLKHFQVYDEIYCFHPDNWDRGKVNTVNLSISRWNNLGKIQSFNKVSLSSTIMGTYYDFSKLILEGTSNVNLNPLILKTRYFAGYTRGEIPAQELFYLSGASPIDEYSTSFPAQYFRSRGLIPNTLIQNHHIYLEGGVNLRGYQDQNSSGTRAAYLNITISNKNMTNIAGYITPYLFYDIGNVDSEIRNGFILQFFQPFKHDIGIGINFKLPPIFNIIGLENIRVDFPVWISHPTNPSEDNFKYRWLIALNKGY